MMTSKNYIFIAIPLMVAVACLSGCSKKQSRPTATVSFQQSNKLPTQPNQPNRVGQYTVDLIQFAKSNHVMNAVAARCNLLYPGQTQQQTRTQISKQLTIKQHSSSSEMFEMKSAEANEVLACVSLTIWSEEIKNATNINQARINMLEMQERIDKSAVDPESKILLARLEQSTSNMEKIKSQIEAKDSATSNIDFAKLARDLENKIKDMDLSEPADFVTRAEAVLTSIQNARTLPTSPSPPTPTTPALNAAANELKLLQIQLTELQSQFGDNHPTVIALKKKIESQEKAPTPTEPVNDAVNQPKAPNDGIDFHKTLELLNTEIQVAKSMIQKIHAEIAKHEREQENLSYVEAKFAKAAGTTTIPQNTLPLGRFSVLRPPTTSTAKKSQVDAYKKLQQESGGKLPVFEFRMNR